MFKKLKPHLLSFLVFASLFLFFLPQSVNATFSTVFSDDFTGSNGTLLSDHNNAWVTTYGDGQIQDNTFYSGPSTISLANLGGFVLTNQCASADFLFPVVNGVTFSVLISPANYLYKYYDYLSVENTIEIDYATPYGVTRIGDQVPYSLSPGWHNHKLCFIDGQLTAYLDNIPMSSQPVSVLQNLGITSGYSDIQIGLGNYMDNYKLEGTTTSATPVVGSVTVSPNPVTVNTSVTATTTFTDSDSGDTHTATANWGISGHSSDSCSVIEPSGSTPGSVSCSLSSGYSSANVYSVTITVSDGTTHVSSSPTYVSVYDVNSSFIGSSSYDNPLGASPSTTGKVKFGITAKFANSVLSGHAKFNFKNANIDFASTTLTSLVTVSGKAYLTGTGTVNGSGSYTFLATGIDQNTSGGNGLVRFKIVNSSNNTVVYDSQPSAGDYADSTTAVNNGGGTKVQ